MDPLNTLKSKLETRSLSSAASTLNESTSSEMKSENTSVPETRVPIEDRMESKEGNAPREVDWDSDNDTDNPRNWPKWKKW